MFLFVVLTCDCYCVYYRVLVSYNSYSRTMKFELSERTHIKARIAYPFDGAYFTIFVMHSTDTAVVHTSEQVHLTSPLFAASCLTRERGFVQT